MTQRGLKKEGTNHMSPALNFLQSEHLLALLIAILIFLTTIFLVAKRWIGFSITLLLLLFSLAAGLLINYQQELLHYLRLSSSPIEDGMTTEDFHKQMLKAVEDLKLEVSTEKENLRLIMTQVQEIINSMDMQKQKLQNFIEETRERFKTDYPTEPASSSPGGSKLQ
jgi:hypothetical protein